MEEKVNNYRIMMFPSALMDSAGGIGSIGGLLMTPKVLTKEILRQGMYAAVGLADFSNHTSLAFEYAKGFW